ncbi:hypothetical protein B296_00039407 [Ensete ventricosum]|uniref:Uncharacterized protein n=1 Tax=Ensete ventricosum TaxID=4639 RepID=A0A426Y387_ENSVE|nr:hypothetical protein B296_00039407 [Ensete ventricosum]
MAWAFDKRRTLRLNLLFAYRYNDLTSYSLTATKAPMFRLSLMLWEESQGGSNLQYYDKVPTSSNTQAHRP